MTTETEDIDGIAIIGMSCRFPEADTIDQFWQNLVNGKDCISELSIEEARLAGIPESIINQKNYIHRGGRLKNPEMFDASFFGFSPKDAKIIDPQHRLFLTCGWEALESAGYDVSSIQQPVGVFAGCSFNYYLLNNVIRNPEVLSNYFELQTLFSSDKDFLSTRLSYKLNLRGPSLTVQTACSSSLVAIHIACQNLLMYQCDMALAGGASLQIPWWNGYMIGDADIRSTDGVCRPFDSKANGTIFGEGVGIVVLKRLQEAIDDGDHIYAVIKGTAINNDGSVKAGFTAPSVDGQTEVITMALETANVKASDISYIETHGTGTPLGDPVEISALTKAYRHYTDNKNFCGIGSVKANIGHLDAAAGIAGLIKTALSLHNKYLPPSINFSEPNPLLKIEETPFYVVKNGAPWNASAQNKRYAGVSSLGVGGTNVHIILEEAPEIKKIQTSKKWHFLPVSAKSISSLNRTAQNYASSLLKNNTIDIGDIAFTMQQGRQHFPIRQFAVAQSQSDGVEQFSSLAISESDIKKAATGLNNIVFMFTGQGSQYISMGKGLYKAGGIFRATFDYCCDFLSNKYNLDIRNSLFSETEADASLLQKTNLTQPLLFSFEYSLAKYWESLGIIPSAMIGHSIGEYVAACLSGVFTLDEALDIVVERGKIMFDQPRGKMISVNVSAEEIKPLLWGDLEIALVNTPTLTVIAGNENDINNLQTTLTQKNIESRLLQTSHAFHSKSMDAAIEPFAAYLSKFTLKKPAIPFISNTTGTWITDSQAQDPLYWGQHIRKAVNFTAGINSLLDHGYHFFLEIGPGNALCSFVNKISTGWHSTHKESPHDKAVTFTSIRHSKIEIDDEKHFLTTLGQLWQYGFKPQWEALYLGEKRTRIPLPTYSFDDKKFWINPTKNFYYGMGIQNEISNMHNNSLTSDDDSDPQLKENRASEVKVESSDDLTVMIINIWKEVLGSDDIKSSDNFFELGGDSLLAVQMFSKIQKKTGINLSLATLFKSPSIEQLVKALGKPLIEKAVTSIHNSPDKELDNSFSYIVPIKQSGSRTPFFCVHCVGGNVLNYNAFIPYLDQDQPLYGIQCKGLDGIEKPFNSIKIMAECYINEMKKIQPNGPYLIGGGSMGGLVAYEMAQQLQKKGDAISLLLMLDSGCPYNVNKIPIASTNTQPNKKQKRSIILQIVHSIDCRISDFRKYTTCHFYRLQGKAIPHELRYWLIEQKHLSLLDRYNPEPYPGVITMFRATQNDLIDPYRGWKDVAKGGMKIIDFECDHTNIVENVEIAKGLNDVLMSMNLKETIPLL